jgi:hypothetical protein
MIPDEPDLSEPVGDASRRSPEKARPLAIVFVGLVAFVAGLFILGFASIVGFVVSSSGLVAFGVCFVIVAALFVVRRRSGASPYLSAVAVGAAVALVVVGGCIALVTNGGRIGG